MCEQVLGYASGAAQRVLQLPLGAFDERDSSGGQRAMGMCDVMGKCLLLGDLGGGNTGSLFS